MDNSPAHESTSVQLGLLCPIKMNIEMKMFTDKEGQYLAFIHNYSKIHGQAPSEADLEGYFRITPPTVHQMILKLEEKGLIS